MQDQLQRRSLDFRFLAELADVSFFHKGTWQYCDEIDGSSR
mgnify:CR=1 FL=1|jgi:hypothetical protein